MAKPAFHKAECICPVCLRRAEVNGDVVRRHDDTIGGRCPMGGHLIPPEHVYAQLSSTGVH